MNEIPVIKGNIWDYHDQGHYVAITTNGVLDRDGNLVMGAGIALEAKNKFREVKHILPETISVGIFPIEKILGEHVKYNRNVPCFLEGIRIVSFPTKNLWRDPSSIELICNSFRLICSQLWWSDEVDLVDPNYKDDGVIAPDSPNHPQIYCPLPGCGNGGLKWEDVSKAILDMGIPPYIHFVSNR